MLETIRRAQPAIIKAVLGAVVVAFVATIFLDWGWRRSSRPDTQLATVGGEGVSMREFQMTYNNLVDFYRRIYQDRFTEDFARTLNLRQQALDTLVQRKLLLHEARGQGIMVTDAELIERVQSYPVFQVDNNFDRTRYLQVLRLSRLTPGDFEQNQREELLLAKLENLIKDAVQVSETEVKEAFIRDKEQLNMEYYGSIRHSLCHRWRSMTVICRAIIKSIWNASGKLSKCALGMWSSIQNGSPRRWK
jgi:peptidyl-prolyl cis-trans isomerase D